MNLGQRLGAAVNAAVPTRREPWREIGERVRVEVERLEPVVFEIWQTAADERTCPICGQLNGDIWKAGEGFSPPIHDHCRCQRVYHHTDFRTPHR
ncbi:MAG: phage head morphogenesis protein [Thermomicrobiales bacterium]|nr:phage head morphogenesis protein [Thermomicrobiales bacterium]